MTDASGWRPIETAPRGEKTERNAEIYRRVCARESLSVIAREMGISRTRAAELFRKEERKHRRAAPPEPTRDG